MSQLLACGYRSRDAKNQDGQTAVHIAARAGRDNILAKLIESGSTVNVRDSFGYTPLHVSVRFDLRLEDSASVARLRLPQPKRKEPGWADRGPHCRTRRSRQYPRQADWEWLHCQRAGLLRLHFLTRKCTFWSETCLSCLHAATAAKTTSTYTNRSYTYHCRQKDFRQIDLERAARALYVGYNRTKGAQTSIHLQGVARSLPLQC